MKLREHPRNLAILRAAMRRLGSVIVISATLVLGACGGDDNNNASNNTATTQTTAPQPATGTTGKSGEKSKSKSGKSQSGGSTSGGGGTQTTKTTTQTQTTTQTGTTPTPPPPTPYKTAKNVCANILPTAVKRDLKRGKTTKKKVAKSYSTGWPADQRKQAYKGCLAGLG
jgi:hypothetical protein